MAFAQFPNIVVEMNINAERSRRLLQNEHVCEARIRLGPSSWQAFFRTPSRDGPTQECLDDAYGELDPFVSKKETQGN